MPQVITLPNQTQVTITAYVAAWRKLLQLPVDHELRGWNYEPTPAGQILTEIRAGIHDRINLRAILLESDPRFTDYKNRKRTSDWQRHAAQLARRLNTPRLIVRLQDAKFLGRRALAKLSHRLYTSTDY